MSKCVLHTGTVNPRTGYGMVYIPCTKRGAKDGRQYLAHRFAYQQAHGDIPSGLVVMHTCDVRLCINPEHLKLGTYKENMQDMHNKKRWYDRRGQNHPLAKLTDVEAEQVRQLRLYSPLTGRAIAKAYGISEQLVSVLRHGTRKRAGSYPHQKFTQGN